MASNPSTLAFQHLAPELRLYCGDGSLAALARELKRAGCRRAAIVSGRSVAGTHAMELLRGALGPLLAGETHTVRANSPVSAVEECAQALRDCEADAVIAVGGGSAAVSARAASIVLAEKQPVSELCTRRLPTGDFHSPRLDAAKLPQFVVPTTPSTAFVKAGSAVHHDVTGERLALFDPKTRARAVFLHPAFLRTAPADLLRSAALNTLSTAIEALESPKCDPMSEALLMQAVRLVARHVDASLDEGAPRERMAIAAVLCGRGTDQSGGGLASVLGHAIGHRTHVPNGIVNAIVLPHTMRFNAPVTRDAWPRIAESLGSANEAVEALESLLARLPVPRRLRDIAVAEGDLDAIAEAALSDWFITRAPRRVAGTGELRSVLRQAW